MNNAKWVLAAAIVVLSSVGAAVAAEGRPNIVYILCDDLGYGDVRCLNPAGKIATPHLDRLAAAGMIFTDAHSGSSVCSPTRYGILTGRYAWRSRLKQGVLGGLSPRLIEPGRMTVASLLQQNGYRTACIGKWHLGMNWVKFPGKEVTELGIETPDQAGNVDYAQPTTGGPNSVGFDEFFGISGSLDMVPYTFIENDHVVKVPTEKRRFPMTGPADQQVFTREGPAAPGFEASDVLPTFTQKAIEFVTRQADAAERGEPFFLYLPLASPHTPIAPTGEWQGKSGLNSYADFVMQTDWSIGQVLDCLDKLGLADNTLVVVTSDNGCSPLAGFDWLVQHGHHPSGSFRGYKADIYDGGHHLPFIVRWPGKVAAGSRSHQLICHTDLLATCAEILAVKLPDNAGEDSVSLLPALLAKADKPLHEAIVHHSAPGDFAIRQDNWKLALCPGSGGWSYPKPGKDDTSQLPLVQLFDLASDPGETTNLQGSQPEVVERLTRLLEKYVEAGRSTPGGRKENTTPVDIWRAAKADHRPLGPKKAGQPKRD